MPHHNVPSNSHRLHNYNVFLFLAVLDRTEQALVLGRVNQILLLTLFNCSFNMILSPFLAQEMCTVMSQVYINLIRLLC